jgi:hypothetical protein
MSRRGSLAITAEIDGAAIDAINKRLAALDKDGASKAMRNGFRKWGNITKKVVAANAPFGRAQATEKIRGVTRPNVHLKWNVITKVKGYARGKVVWMAIGIREIKGSYLTPHWYLRWIEYGHEVKRGATKFEQIVLKARGYEKKKEYSKVTIGRVPANPFLRRSMGETRALLFPIMRAAVAKQLEEEGLA